MEQKEIFISYCRNDIAIAREIKNKIEPKTSVSCWMDMEGIESGSQFQEGNAPNLNTNKETYIR